MTDTPFAEWQAAGLPLPPVPPTLAPALVQIGPWLWATRTDLPASLYDISTYVEEIEAGLVTPYLAIGHAGHGVNSWALHYYLVLPPMALFVQSAWAGLGTDDPTARTRLGERLDDIAHLLPLLTGAGDLAVVCIESDFLRSGWAPLPAGDPWESTDRPLRATYLNLQYGS